MKKSKGRGETLIPGYHAVRNALEQRSLEIFEIWMAEGKRSERASIIRKLAAEGNIPVFVRKRAEIDSLFPDLAHQGFVAVAQGFSYYKGLEHILEISSHSPGEGLIIAADHITDEGNLAALIRTAAFFGAHGLVLPKDRSAGLSPKVLKRASGALIHLPICRVVNLGRTLDYLEKMGFWIVGASGESPNSIYDFDLTRDLIVVMGNEQRGLSPSVRKRCHEILSIPGKGSVESLNIGVAAGVLLSEICRQRAS